MPLLLNVLETYHFFKSLFSCKGTTTSIQLESLPLRERGSSLSLALYVALFTFLFNFCVFKNLYLLAVESLER